MSVGTITPVAMIPVTAGDRMRFQPSTFIQAMAMKAPLVNGFKLCLEYFFAPNRLYQGQLLLDEINTTDEPSRVIVPTLQPQRVPNKTSVTLDNDSYDLRLGPANPEGRTGFLLDAPDLVRVMVQPGSLANFMGFPVGWVFTKDPVSTAPPVDNDAADGNFFNVTAACGYLDIYLSYYANQQYDDFLSSAYVYQQVAVGDQPSDPTVSPSYAASFRQIEFPLVSLQRFMSGLKRSPSPSQFIFEWLQSEDLSPETIMSWQWLCSPCSLFQRSLPPYYLEQWLKTSFVDGIDNTIKVDATDSSVVFTDIRRASHIQRYLELAMAGGSRYSDYVEAQFDLGRVKNYSTPLFLGSDRQFLGSRVIYQTTGFDNSDSPLGAFAGQASGGDRHRKRSFSFSEDGTFYVMATLVPDTIYYRGLDPALRQIRLDDFYTPSRDNIGLEPLPVERLDSLPPVLKFSQVANASDTWDISLGRDVSGLPTDQQRALGYVPAWSSMMQRVSRAHGALEGDLKYWLLAREYSGQPFPESLSRVIDQNLEALATWYGMTKGNFPSDIDALRTFFDNLRQNSLYTPYIQNHLYNSVFADTSVDAKNFILTLSMDITVNREKSKINIPSTI